jgi:hypothetical protein
MAVLTAACHSGTLGGTHSNHRRRTTGGDVSTCGQQPEAVRDAQCSQFARFIAGSVCFRLLILIFLYTFRVDGGTNKAPGGLYTGTDPNVAPGALLSIPANISETIKTTTVVGAKIKQALVDYGAYIVDDTGGGNSAAICMEAAVNSEMRAAYGYAMTYPHGVSGSVLDPGAALYRDLVGLFQGLHAVVNNGPTMIGGGGTPRVPTKPPICQ